MSELKVGDTVYVVFNERYRTNRPARVESIGRKWIRLDVGCKMEKGSMILDGEGYSSPGRCYLTEQDYLSEKEKQRMWFKLKDEMTWTAPSSVSNDDIKAAMKLLGISHD